VLPLVKGGDRLPRRRHDAHTRREVADHADIRQSSDTWQHPRLPPCQFLQPRLTPLSPSYSTTRKVAKKHREEFYVCPSTYPTRDGNVGGSEWLHKTQGPAKWPQETSVCHRDTSRRLTSISSAFVEAGSVDYWVTCRSQPLRGAAIVSRSSFGVVVCQRTRLILQRLGLKPMRGPVAQSNGPAWGARALLASNTVCSRYKRIVYKIIWVSSLPFQSVRATFSSY